MTVCDRSSVEVDKNTIRNKSLDRIAVQVLKNLFVLQDNAIDTKRASTAQNTQSTPQNSLYNKLIKFQKFTKSRYKLFKMQ